MMAVEWGCGGSSDRGGDNRCVEPRRWRKEKGGEGGTNKINKREKKTMEPNLKGTKDKNLKKLFKRCYRNPMAKKQITNQIKRSEKYHIKMH